MPKVRASSGMMGITRSPMALSLMSAVRIRTNAIVLEISRSPLPSSCLAKCDNSGVFRPSLFSKRMGITPPNFSLCLRM